MDKNSVSDRRKQRLAELIDAKFEGNTTAAGRYLGYTDGAMLRQMLKGIRPITEKTVEKWSGLVKVGRWFEEGAEELAPTVNSDLVFPLAHGVSQPSATVEVPHLTWTDLMTGTKPLPPTFDVTLTDDAMAPDFPEGTVITFSTQEGEPRALDCVLVQDGDGQVFFREYRLKKPGVWHAAALNPGYEPLDAAAERLQVLAIMIKNTKVGRRSAWGK